MTLAKGRLTPAPPAIASIREISRDDLPRLAGPRAKAHTYPERLRESHHTVARLLALDDRNHARVAALTGYSINRVSQLAQAPAMVELIAHYREKLDETWQEAADAYADMAIRNMIAAERQLSDKLAEADEEGEFLPVRELVSIAADRADRFGYNKKSTNVNVNVDFADRLDKAIAQSKLKTIEGRGVASTTAPQGPGRGATSSPPTPVPLLRRVS